VAWFPLGPRDVYCPSYHVSQRYVQNVNISNTTVINQTHITNVYNNVYVNKTVNVTNVTYQNQSAAGAVTATSHQAFTSAQPVGRNMVKVDAREVASAPVAPMTPAVAPQQHSVLGSGAAASVKPPAASFNRQVVAKNTPPPAPVSFAKQQQVIQANGGRPVGVTQMRQTQTENVQAPRPNIKIAPPAQPSMPRNVQANRPTGNMPTNQGNVQNKPANVQNNQGNVPNNPGNMQNSSNRPPVTSTSSPANSGNRNGNSPANTGNPPSNPGNPKAYNDRPPSNRPSNSNNVDPQIEQKHQQQLEQLRLKQDQERQKIEQKQVQEQQRIQQKNAEDARRQQVDQRQQQQLQQLEQKHEQEQQRLQQKQQQERQTASKPSKPADKPSKPPKEEKPHK
jgi:hypothetical protein